MVNFSLLSLLETDFKIQSCPPPQLLIKNFNFVGTKKSSHYSHGNSKEDRERESLHDSRRPTFKRRMLFGSQLQLPFSTYLRTSSSLQCFWVSINKDATKFNIIFAQLKSNSRSGWNQAKYEEEALKLYKEEVKEDFKFLSCWVYLKEKPKWVDTLDLYAPLLQKSSNGGGDSTFGSGLSTSTEAEVVDIPDTKLRMTNGAKLPNYIILFWTSKLQLMRG